MPFDIEQGRYQPSLLSTSWIPGFKGTRSWNLGWTSTVESLESNVIQMVKVYSCEGGGKRSKKNYLRKFVSSEDLHGIIESGPSIRTPGLTESGAAKGMQVI
ncbi:hypothetical protein GWK47_016159 [Chionoecetes opilio]|uniref:Uncharacterized protein n=1 Tax=Chionoecetes opilio TaxID=41210 RepID=A0A8J5CMN6_CHIOP|nr:hypothetical protein GWK47_016159 [Chionoecetes opilio]